MSSFLASIFGGASSASATPAPTTNPEPSATPLTPSNSTENSGVQNGGSQLGIDKFAKMFDNSGKQNAQPENFDLPAEAVDKLAGSQNFLGGIPQEVMQGVQSGDPKAFLAAIDMASKNAYAQAIRHTTKLTDAHLQGQQPLHTKQVEEIVRQTLAKQSASTIPNSTNPIVGAEINRLAQAYLTNNPDASPSDATKAAQEYIQELARAITGTPAATGQEDSQVDYDKFFR